MTPWNVIDRHRLDDIAQDIVASLFGWDVTDIEPLLVAGSKARRMFDLLDRPHDDEQDALWDAATIYLACEGVSYRDMTNAQRVACALVADQLDTICDGLIEGWGA